MNASEKYFTEKKYTNYGICCMGKRFPDSALDIMGITCYPVTVADSRFTREYLLQVPPLIAAGAGQLKTIS